MDPPVIDKALLENLTATVANIEQQMRLTNERISALQRVLHAHQAVLTELVESLRILADIQEDELP